MWITSGRVIQDCPVLGWAVKSPEHGTWHVVTRSLTFQPYFESGFPHGHDQWISQAGSALAAMALTFAAK